MISVIIPVYNVEKYLKRCLDSVLRQNSNEYEIILVDDGSTDNSSTICDEYKTKYPNKITVIHKANEGLGYARNTGMEAAKGEYFFFLDSDDWIPKGTLQYLLELERKENADIISFKYKMVYDESEYNNELEGNDDYTVLKDKKSIMYSFLKGDISDTACTKLYRRFIFDDEKFTNVKVYEDSYSMHLFLNKANTMLLSEKICYLQYVRRDSLFQSKIQDKNFGLIECGQRLIDFIKELKYDDLVYYAEVRMLEKKLFITNKILMDKMYLKYKREFWKIVNENRLKSMEIQIDDVGKNSKKEFSYLQKGTRYYFIRMSLYYFCKRLKHRIMK